MDIKQRKENNVTIQHYYKTNFIKLVVFPLILVFVAGLLLVLRDVNIEQVEKLDIASSLVADTLEAEISNYSVELSRLIVNNKDVLENLTYYSNALGEERFEYSKELESDYNSSVDVSQPIVTTDFYMDNGIDFNFASQFILESVDIQSEEWYIDAMNNPDKVRTSIINRELLFQHFPLESDTLLIFSIAMNDLGRGNEVKLGTMCVMSQGISLIEDNLILDDKIHVYLLDETNNIILSSTDMYDEKISEVVSGDKKYSNLKYDVSEITKTKWKVVAITDSNEVAQSYQIIILLIAGGVFLVLFFLYFFVRRLLRDIINPINQLSKVMYDAKENNSLEECHIDGLYEINVIGQAYNTMVGDIHELMVINEKKEKEKLKEAIKALELQLDPHFLSNTLGSIRFMAVVAQFEGIQKMTESLINILNASFRNKNSFHSLEEELLVLESYVYIMRIRYANSFEVNFDVDRSCLKSYVPKLLLQPFVENAITHGLKNMDGDGEINIIIQRIGEDIKFNIRDNGQGISTMKIVEIMSIKADDCETIGVANINKRLCLYYGEEYGISIESEVGKYTDICFLVPYSIEGGE